MALRVGYTGWSAWVVYLVVGTMQLVLIAMGLSFKITGETAPDEIKRPGSIVSFHFEGWEPSLDVATWRRTTSTSTSMTRSSSMTSSQLAPDERRPLLAWMEESALQAGEEGGWR